MVYTILITISKSVFSHSITNPRCIITARTVLRTDTQYDQFSIGALMEIDGDHLAPIMSMLRHVRHDVGNMKQSILDALERIQEHLIKTGLNWAESIPSSFEELSLSPKVKTNECRLKALEFTRL